MEINEQLIRAITNAVVEQLKIKHSPGPQFPAPCRDSQVQTAWPGKHGCVPNVPMTVQ